MSAVAFWVAKARRANHFAIWHEVGSIRGDALRSLRATYMAAARRAKAGGHVLPEITL